MLGGAEASDGGTRRQQIGHRLGQLCVDRLFERRRDSGWKWQPADLGADKVNRRLSRRQSQLRRGGKRGAYGKLATCCRRYLYLVAWQNLRLYVTQVNGSVLLLIASLSNWVR